MRDNGTRLLLCDCDNTLTAGGRPNRVLVDCLRDASGHTRIWCVSNRTSSPPPSLRQELARMGLVTERIVTPVTRLLADWSHLSKPVYLCSTASVAHYVRKEAREGLARRPEAVGTVVLFYKSRYSHDDRKAIGIARARRMRCIVGHLDFASPQSLSPPDSRNLGQIAQSLLGDAIENVIVLGKPNPQMVLALTEFTMVHRPNVLVIGDDPCVDTAFARNVGCGAFLLAGQNTLRGTLITYPTGRRVRRELDALLREGFR